MEWCRPFEFPISASQDVSGGERVLQGIGNQDPRPKDFDGAESSGPLDSEESEVSLHCGVLVALAKEGGLNPATAVEVISAGAGGSWALQNLGPKMVAGDFAPGFMIDLLCKDLKYTLELGAETGQPLAGASLAQRLFDAAQAAGLGREGTQALYKTVCG